MNFALHMEKSLYVNLNYRIKIIKNRRKIIERMQELEYGKIKWEDNFMIVWATQESRFKI